MSVPALFSLRGRAGRMQWWSVTVPLLVAGSVFDALADLPAAQRAQTIVDLAGWAFAIVMIWLLVGPSPAFPSARRPRSAATRSRGPWICVTSGRRGSNRLSGDQVALALGVKGYRWQVDIFARDHFL